MSGADGTISPIASRQQRARICDESPLNTALNWTKAGHVVTLSLAGALGRRNRFSRSSMYGSPSSSYFVLSISRAMM